MGDAWEDRVTTEQIEEDYDNKLEKVKEILYDYERDLGFDDFGE